MIDELQVSNIALIREATLVPSAGLTVLTGETGAGKTALLSALKLILGERADSSTVREGEALASVEARLFDGPHDTEGFTVQRSLSAEGRSRVKIDGRIASVRELSERVGVMMGSVRPARAPALARSGASRCDGRCVGGTFCARGARALPCLL